MPQNLELKSKVRALPPAGVVAKNLGARKVGTSFQSDTYFVVPAGRLKLREVRGKRSELIWYLRPDTKRARYSDFRIVSLPRSSRLKWILFRLFDVKVVVKKKRVVYLFQNARIHLDRVEKLGTFVEFEVLVTRGRQQARQMLRRLVNAFEFPRASVVGGSYSDLIEKTKRKRPWRS